MTNNDILRRLRYALEFKDVTVAKCFRNCGAKTNLDEVGNWLRREDHPSFAALSDVMLCRFLDGLVIEKRGHRPDGGIPEPRAFLSNNEILKKLRIALGLRDEEMIAVFKREEFVVTKAELGSFFRREGQRNYAKCPEQVLRKFLQGLGKKEDSMSTKKIDDDRRN